MFASVAYYYRRGTAEADPVRLRQEVCDFMDNNLKGDFNGLSIEDLVNTARLDLMALFPKFSFIKSVSEYITYMRQIDSYGDALELMIIAHIRKIAIIIYAPDESGRFKFREAITTSAEGGKVIYLNFTGNIHYENLIIEEEEVREELRVKHGIQSPSTEKTTFDHQVNELKVAQFGKDAHEESLKKQSVINDSMILRKVPAVGSGKDSSTKTGSSLMDVGRSTRDPVTEPAKSQCNVSAFEEEESIITYDESEKIR